MAYKIHHIARVVGSINREIGIYRSLGFECDDLIKTDYIHGAKVGIVKLGDGLFIELLEPYDRKSPIRNFLSRGGGFHHICYSVKDLDKKLFNLKKTGSILSKPAPSVFGGRKVFFFGTPGREIIEFIEAQRKN